MLKVAHREEANALIGICGGLDVLSGKEKAAVLCSSGNNIVEWLFFLF